MIMTFSWQLGPTVNVKHNENSSHMYDVTITTEVWRQAGTSASVFAKIYGTESSTKDVNLTGNAPPGRKLFARGSIDRIVLHLDNQLGSVFKVEIWYDNNGKSSSWFLDQVHIVERSTGEKWDFFYHNWLALQKDNGTIAATLMSREKYFSLNDFRPGRLPHLGLCRYQATTQFSHTRSACLLLPFFSVFGNGV